MPKSSQRIKRIIIAKPDRLYADALQIICQQLFPHTEIIQCHSGQDVLHRLQTQRVDLLLLSLSFEDTNGADFLQTVSQKQWVKNMLVFIKHRFEPVLTALRTAPVNAVIDEYTDTLENVKTALSGIEKNLVYISPSLKPYLLSETRYSHNLTVGECRVIQVIGTGCDNQEAAAILGLQESTVQTHRRNIMRKLNVSTSAKLVNEAVRLGFVSISSAGIISPLTSIYREEPCLSMA